MIKDIYLHRLKVFHEFQIRNDKTTKAHVKELKVAYQNGQSIPPIVVAELSGVLYVADGFHRVQALKELGYYSADAEIVKVKNEDEIRWIAVERNRTHGKKLSNKDKHDAFDIFIKNKKYLDVDGSCKSSRKMAEAFGLWSNVQISKTLKKRYKAIYRRMKRDNQPTEYLREATKVYTEGRLDKNEQECTKINMDVLDTARDIYKLIPVMTDRTKQGLFNVCKEMLKKLVAEGVKDEGNLNYYHQTGSLVWLNGNDNESEF